jgi:hypothetical protein
LETSGSIISVVLNKPMNNRVMPVISIFEPKNFGFPVMGVFFMAVENKVIA